MSPHAYLSAYIPAFPKPKQVKRDTGPVRVFPDGREVCRGGTNDPQGAEGRAEYKRRVRAMWERQGGICCFYGHIEECPGRLAVDQATFDHENKRGAGKRDDRIEVDGKWQNGAAHAFCNNLVGSRRINYND